MNEILTCIKLIKMYAWEKPFSNKINGMSTYCMDPVSGPVVGRFEWASTSIIFVFIIFFCARVCLHNESTLSSKRLF